MSDQAGLTKKKVTPLNILIALLLVLVVQFLAIGITYENKPEELAIGQTNGTIPLPPSVSGTPAGSAINAFLLVGLVALVTFGFVWLIRKRLFRSFKALIFASVSFSAFILTLLTVDGFFSRFTWYSTFPYVLEVEALIALLPVVAMGYSIFVKNNEILSSAVLVVIAAEVASFFASSLIKELALFLALFFAGYDIYAVFKGPLKTLVSAAPSGSLVGMAVKAGEFTIGLGDIVFYSMLPSMAFFYIGAIPALETLAAVDLGVVVTLYLLTRKRLLPGLPIPMLLGLIVLTISLFLAKSL